jgi:outer membrane protein assembly factor BamB
MLPRPASRRLIASICLLLASSARAGDWPQWRGPERDGIAADEQIRTDWSTNPPKLLWMVDGMGQGYASVSIVHGRLYTTGNRGSVQAVTCVDASTGKELWSKPISERSPKHSYPGSRCTPTIDGDRLYAIASDGRIVAMKTSDGTVAWSHEFDKYGGKLMSGWGFSESPLVDADRVLFTPGGPQAMIVAVNKVTGREIWRSNVPNLGNNGKDGAGYSSIVVSEGAGVKQYVQLTGRGVIGVRATDGKFLWGYNKVANGTANIPTPLVSGDHVFVSTGYNTGAALLHLQKSGGGIKAEEKYFLSGNEFQNHHGGMILKGDHVYAGHQHKAGFPVCLELKTGKIVWGGRLRGAGSGSAALTCVGDNLIYRYENGVVAAVAAYPGEYRLLGTFTPEYQEKESWSHPVVVDGKLYLREQDKLMCYDVAG